MLTKEELFTKYVENVQALDENSKRKGLPAGGSLNDFYSRYAFICSLLELKKVSQAHVFGLSACMKNLCGKNSSLCLLSLAFEQMTEKLAGGILTLTLKKKSSPAVQKLVQWWLMLSLMAVIGLLELKAAKQSQRQEEIPPDVDFQNELLLLLFFATNYPKIVFKEMAESIEIPQEKIATFTALFELLALAFALSALSKEEEGLKRELVNDLLPNIEKNLALVLSALGETDRTRSFLEQIQIALEKDEIDNLTLICQDFLESEGYSRELLFKDISAIKSLFIRLKQACQDAKARPSNTIHMAG